MDDTAGILSMKAQFIPLSITFGSCGKRAWPLSVLFISKKVRYFGRRSGSRWKRLQKTGTIAKLSYLE